MKYAIYFFLNALILAFLLNDSMLSCDMRVGLAFMLGGCSIYSYLFSDL